MIHCLITRGANEANEVLKARIACAIDAVSRQAGKSLETTGAATLTPHGLAFDDRWHDSSDEVPSDVCVIASYPVGEEGNGMPWNPPEVIRVVRNPQSSRLLFRFRAAKAAREREGQTCELFAVIDQPNASIGYQMLPMLKVRFSDGLVMAVDSDELAGENGTVERAKNRLVQSAQQRIHALEAA